MTAPSIFTLCYDQLHYGWILGYTFNQCICIYRMPPPTTNTTEEPDLLYKTIGTSPHLIYDNCTQSIQLYYKKNESAELEELTESKFHGVNLTTFHSICWTELLSIPSVKLIQYQSISIENSEEDQLICLYPFEHNHHTFLEMNILFKKQCLSIFKLEGEDNRSNLILLCYLDKDTNPHLLEIDQTHCKYRSKPTFNIHVHSSLQEAILQTHHSSAPFIFRLICSPKTRFEESCTLTAQHDFELIGNHSTFTKPVSITNSNDMVLDNFIFEQLVTIAQCHHITITKCVFKQGLHLHEVEQSSIQSCHIDTTACLTTCQHLILENITMTQSSPITISECSQIQFLQENVPPPIIWVQSPTMSIGQDCEQSPFYTKVCSKYDLVVNKLYQFYVYFQFHEKEYRLILPKTYSEEKEDIYQLISNIKLEEEKEEEKENFGLSICDLITGQWNMVYGILSADLNAECFMEYPSIITSLGYCLPINKLVPFNDTTEVSSNLITKLDFPAYQITYLDGKIVYVNSCHRTVQQHHGWNFEIHPPSNQPCYILMESYEIYIVHTNLKYHAFAFHAYTYDGHRCDHLSIAYTCPHNIQTAWLLESDHTTIHTIIKHGLVVKTEVEEKDHRNQYVEKNSCDPHYTFHIHHGMTVLFDMELIYDIVCFVAGTKILTPKGYLPIENLTTEDCIITPDNRSSPILEINIYETCICSVHMPYVIPCHYFGPNKPFENLLLSSSHAVYHPQRNLFIQMQQLQLSKITVQDYIAQYDAPSSQQSHSIVYYHLKVENYQEDFVVSNGIITEAWDGLQAHDQRRYGKNTNVLTHNVNLKRNKKYRKFPLFTTRPTFLEKQPF